MHTKQLHKMTDAEYFALKAVSASQIKQYDKGAYWFWRSSPFNPTKPIEPESDALVFGKLCHAFILEPERLQTDFAIADFGALRKNKKYEEVKAQYPNKTIVSKDEWNHARLMLNQLQLHPLASAILDGATAEMPYVWTDASTGLKCKIKCDAIKRTKAGLVVIDYKTSSDIEGLLNWPQKLQYPLQADFYCRGIQDKYGEEPVEFVFIIQSNKPDEKDIIAIANVEYETQLVAHTVVDHHLGEISEKLQQWNKTHDASIFAAYPNRVEMRYSNWYMER